MADGSGPISMPNVSTGASPVGHYLRKFASMKTERLAFDRFNQMVSDYELPRRSFSVTLPPGQLRPHRVTSSVATALGIRLAANVLANMIDPTRPNLLPNVKRGLAVAGRDVNLDDDGMQYLDHIGWTIFDRMMLPRAHLLERLGAALVEFVFFGNGVIWCGRKRGFGPTYNARPFQACWWSENEYGEIDTLYFKMKLPVYRVLLRWPNAVAVPGWADLKEDDEQQLTDVLICVEPRPDGSYGAVKQAKPFKYVCIAEDKGFILEESGFDSFPYAVFRNNPLPGMAYAEGQGYQALADVMTLNHMQQAVEHIAEQKGHPPLAWPARMFAKPLDRRPGAANAYNPAGLGIQSAKDAIIKLDMTGDPGPALQHIEYLTKSIGRTFFEDWMQLRESGDMTAAEVDDRKGLRNDGMGSIVSSCAHPMTVLGDRTLEGLHEEAMLPPAPASVAGAEVDWEYAGPLAISQLRGNVQAMFQLIQARGLVHAQDPAAGVTVNLEGCLRTIAGGLAAPMGALSSKAMVQDAKEQQAKQLLQLHQAQVAATAASAAKDGAGAVAALGGGAQPPAGLPGGPAGFAPAAPLAQPVV